ncbi:MAG: four helix bundle protein [Prosthecobacter sp.]|uniref:four helix bundle protein n=1 Tax=Prosthecobacter sp. TaxID=1965333 RepID=UPI003901AD02
MSDITPRNKTIQSFRDLDVYSLARGGAGKVFLLTRTFPREERFSLVDQVRRSSRAVAAMIAEAWARRRYEAAFINKLNEAQGEAMETQSWLDQALDCGYITPDQHHTHDAVFQQLGGKLQRMIEKSSSFCS